MPCVQLSEPSARWEVLSWESDSEEAGQWSGCHLSWESDSEEAGQWSVCPGSTRQALGPI